MNLAKSISEAKKAEIVGFSPISINVLLGILEKLPESVFEWLEAYVLQASSSATPLEPIDSYEAFCRGLSAAQECLSRRDLAALLESIGFRKGIDTRRQRKSSQKPFMVVPADAHAYTILQTALEIVRVRRRESGIDELHGVEALDNALGGKQTLTSSQARLLANERRKKNMLRQRKEQAEQEKRIAKKQLEQKRRIVEEQKRDISFKDQVINGLQQYRGFLQPEEPKHSRDLDPNARDTIQSYRRQIAESKKTIANLEEEIAELEATVEEMRQEKQNTQAELAQCLRGTRAIVETIPAQLSRTQALQIMQAVATMISNLDASRRALVDESMQPFIEELENAVENLARKSKNVSEQEIVRIKKASKNIITQHKAHNRHGLQATPAYKRADLLGNGQPPPLSKSTSKKPSVSAKASENAIVLSQGPAAESDSLMSQLTGFMAGQIVPRLGGTLQPLQTQRVEKSPSNVGSSIWNTFLESATSGFKEGSSSSD